MLTQDDRVTENQVAFAIVQIAKNRPDGIATFDLRRKEVPNYVKLSLDDQAQSQTRPNEELWEQLIRNIQSHHNSAGNYIREGYLIHVPDVGYQVTDAGKRRQSP